MNLVVNANDEVSYGGAITIETKQVNLDESICRQHAEAKFGTYCVLSTRDNGQGMDGEKIQLLITDVVMPGIYGLSLADKSKLNCPDILTLFISGYMENELWQDRILKEGLPFL